MPNYRLSGYDFKEMWRYALGREAEGEYMSHPTVGEVASEPGDRLQVTHVATEATVTRGDESPISVLL